jgi:predicted transglutaminase-like cysteine proteinase
MLNLKSILIAASIGCATATGALGADRISEHATFMKTGGRVPQPVGHYHFCKANPSECGPTVSTGNPIRLTEVAWHVIVDVNEKMNGKIIQVTDDEYYGKPELWTYPKSAGDCEDFALLKKRELKARGFRESDLLITVVKKRDGSGHAILTVRTSEGDFVLDNLDDRVRRWWQTPYRFQKRPSSVDAGQWVLIEQPVTDIPVAAIKD